MDDELDSQVATLADRRRDMLPADSNAVGRLLGETDYSPEQVAQIHDLHRRYVESRIRREIEWSLWRPTPIPHQTERRRQPMAPTPANHEEVDMRAAQFVPTKEQLAAVHDRYPTEGGTALASEFGVPLPVIGRLARKIGAGTTRGPKPSARDQVRGQAVPVVAKEGGPRVRILAVECDPDQAGAFVSRFLAGQ